MGTLECCCNQANSGYTILVVDDDPSVSMVAAILLERMGHRAVRAASGEEALKIFNGLENQITMAILDVTMPGISGWETAEKLWEICPNLPVVMTSGREEGSVMPTPRRGAVMGFLSKPFTRACLEELLAQLPTATNAM